MNKPHLAALAASLQTVKKQRPRPPDIGAAFLWMRPVYVSNCDCSNNSASGTAGEYKYP